MDEEIKRILADHEKRIKELEKAILSKDRTESKVAEKEYDGLSGGIRFLIDNGFLNIPKSVNEIMEELKKEGYHYPRKSINKLLSINFARNAKILTRIKEEKVWKYVVRK